MVQRTSGERVVSSPFEFPNSVTVCPPAVPRLTMTSPVVPEALVFPVVGSPGEQGPAGDSVAVLSYQHTQTSPAMLVQIVHNLPFPPAGIVCQDTGVPALTVEYATVTYPLAGVIELTFGLPFTGTIYLS